MDELNKSVFWITENPEDVPNKCLYFRVFFPKERRLKSSHCFHYYAMLYKRLEPIASGQADEKREEAGDACTVHG